MKAVIIVDDNVPMLNMTKKMLDEKGYLCAGFTDGREALAYLSQHQVDYMVTDLFMPGIDGVELILTVRSEYPDVAIVAMSGGSPLAGDMLGMVPSLGAHAILSKPFTRAELLAALDLAQAACSGASNSGKPETRD
nr:response regulator [uncultured Dongia sp.]